MGPVMDATPEIQALSESEAVRVAAVHKLHQIHHNNVVHHFEESEKDQHIAAWTVVKVRCSRVTPAVWTRHAQRRARVGCAPA